MPGEVKRRQKSINSQESFPCDAYARGVDDQPPALGTQPQRILESLKNVDAELVREVCGLGPAELKLQDELANQALIGSEAVDAYDGKRVFSDSLDILIVVGFVLVVHAREVGKRGHADSQ
jgi:hypothetical protein